MSQWDQILLPPSIQRPSLGSEKPHRAEKNNRYFDFKHLQLWVHIEISYYFLSRRLS